MLKKEELELLSKELHEYRYHLDEIEKANEVLNEVLGDFKAKAAANGNNIIYHDSRIKTPNSFLNKVLRDERDELKEDKIKTTFKNSHDIVGHRIICLNITDIYDFLEIIRSSDKVRILIDDEGKEEIKDYIINRKPSGYRSLHVLIEVPFVDRYGFETSMKAEIQLRTIFMHAFSREEHKLGYKNNGRLSFEDKDTLREISERLNFFDESLDNMFKPVRSEKPGDQEELEIVEEEYNKVSDLYEIIYGDVSKTIKDYCNDFDKKDDILYINSRLKPISSIRRKLKKKKLSYTSKNILFGLKDVIGFKIVLTDIDSVKSFIEYINTKFNEDGKLEISEVSDHLDVPKESGYRGYKVCLNYCPKYIADKPIQIEILIRTMIQEVWSLQQDSKIYNKEDCYNSKDEYIRTYRSLKVLSTFLKEEEDKLNKIKDRNAENKSVPLNLVKEVKEFDRTRKLVLVNKDEE